MLRERYEVARELAADRRAEQACGPRPLLSALLKALEGPEDDPVLTAGLAESAHLDARISRLECGRPPRLPVVSSSSLAWSTVGAVAFLAVFLSAMIGLGGTSALARAAAYELSEAGAPWMLFVSHPPRCGFVLLANRAAGMPTSALGRESRVRAPALAQLPPGPRSPAASTLYA